MTSETRARDVEWTTKAGTKVNITMNTFGGVTDEFRFDVEVNRPRDNGLRLPTREKAITNITPEAARELIYALQYLIQD